MTRTFEMMFVRKEEVSGMNKDDLDDLRKTVVSFETGEVGPDGELTPKGRKELGAKIMDAMKGRYPEKQQEELEAEMTRLLEKLLPIGETMFTSSARTMVIGLKRCITYLEESPRGCMALAQALDNRNSSGGPHIFSLGVASSSLSTALREIEDACVRLEELIECEQRKHAHKGDVTLS